MSKWTSAAPRSGFYFNGQALQYVLYIENAQTQ
jgi:hypothetical protein